MDAVEYQKEKRRMTKNCMALFCNDCPLSGKNNEDGLSCTSFEQNHPEKAVALIEQWAKEHPAKTYKSVFLEKFPDAAKEDGVPAACVVAVFGEKKKPEGCYNSINCSDCWNREVKE